MNDSDRITHEFVPCPKCGELKMAAFSLDGTPLAEAQSCLDCLSKSDRAVLDKQVGYVLARYRHDSATRLMPGSSLGALQAFMKATIHQEDKQC